MRIAALALVPLLSCFSACGSDAKKEPDAGVVKTEAVAAIKAVQKTVGEMMKSLGELKDAASAEKAKASLQQQMEALKTELGQIDAGKLGKAWTAAKTGLAKLANDQAAKFKNDPEMQKVVGPLLEQMKAALEGR